VKKMDEGIGRQASSFAVPAGIRVVDWVFFRVRVTVCSGLSLCCVMCDVTVSRSDLFCYILFFSDHRVPARSI